MMATQFPRKPQQAARPACWWGMQRQMPGGKVRVPGRERVGVWVREGIRVGNICRRGSW